MYFGVLNVYFKKKKKGGRGEKNAFIWLPAMPPSWMAVIKTFLELELETLLVRR